MRPARVALGRPLARGLTSRAIERYA